MLNDNPGPGKYQVPAHEKDLRCPTVIGVRPESDYSTITSKVDLIRPSGMPDRPPQSIGPMDGFHYFMPMPVSPAPVFTPPTFFLSKGMTIGPKRKPEPPNPAPGPGAYSPGEHFPVHGHEFPRMQGREIFRNIPQTPGPGAYETIPQLEKPHRWAGKLRVRTADMREREEARARPWSVAERLPPTNPRKAVGKKQK
jgi:hypothetical protein